MYPTGILADPEHGVLAGKAQRSVDRSGQLATLAIAATFQSPGPALTSLPGKD
jgi:hypothetical protein